MLFEAFTPADDARIAVVVALEAGRSGAHDAAPIARKILDAWLPGDLERAAPPGHRHRRCHGAEAMIDDARHRFGSRLASLWRKPRIDLPLFGALLLLMGVGLVTLYSASDLDSAMVLAQALRFALGLALMLTIARIPPLTLRNWTPWLYAASVLLLVAGGAARRGPRRAPLARSRRAALPAVRTAQADHADDGRLVPQRPPAAAALGHARRGRRADRDRRRR